MMARQEQQEINIKNMQNMHMDNVIHNNKQMDPRLQMQFGPPEVPGPDIPGLHLELLHLNTSSLRVDLVPATRPTPLLPTGGG